MGRSRFKWKCILITYLVLVNVLAKSLPIQTVKLSSLTTTDTIFKNAEVPLVIEDEEEKTTTEGNIDDVKTNTVEVDGNVTRSDLLRNIRPGQEVRQYAVRLTDEGDSFRGRAVINVVLTLERDEPILLHAEGLDISSVRVGVFSDANAVPTDFNLDESVLEISPAVVASSYILDIEYTAPYTNTGRGFHRGEFNGGEGSYLAMNLHPTHARSVFPCVDEPTEDTIISFTFNNIDYTHLISNSALQDNSQNQFRGMQGPPHRWGMVAHSFTNINIPTAQVLLFGRQGLINQDAQASVAINFYFHNLIEWTSKPYFEIHNDQDGRMNIIAFPDIDTDWHSLSTVGIWEPYIFMESVHSIKQRKTALYEIALAMAKQWFGYVIYPENWRFEWVVSGLAEYAAYEMMRAFQNDPLGSDVTLLDVNTLFVTDVIQESLLRDAYPNAHVLEPSENIFDEEVIRDYFHGHMRYKAPAIMRMMRVILGSPAQDFIQSAARALLNGRALQTVNSLNFVDAINSDWIVNGNGAVDDIDEYLETWKENNGYPLLHIGLRQGGILIMQERFSFTSQDHLNYMIPITFTTSINPDFNNYQPHNNMIIDGTATINVRLDEDDWIIFNIQGQGYYRVNYDAELWERIIEALEDPDRREVIHPLNRAALVDDALNLARAGRLDYDTAFRVVLSMELETEYAVWKAFVRNMDFLRLRLVAMVTEDEDLDPDIYLRMVRRTIGSIENELGFYPDVSLSEPAMDTLTRGLVMEHACKANYAPCIAAAVDWFYDSNSAEPAVNPNIPHDIRPAVYCTMVREGDGQVIEVLNDRLESNVLTMYERVVILESLACSQDGGYIRDLLAATIQPNSPYSVEERSKIFVAVARSSYENAFIALNFIGLRANEMRNMYGGKEKFEEVIHVLAENMVGSDLVNDFRIWVNANNNNLDDSTMTAEVAQARMNIDWDWENTHLENVYEWIDENDAPTLMVSLFALCISLIVALMNH